MSGIRVYEAARKINVETKELMRILEELGAPAKSPIAFVTQSDLDAVLDYLTGKDEAGAETKEPRISLVQPPAEKAAAVIPLARLVEDEKAGEKQQAAKTGSEPEKTPAAPRRAPSGGTWAGQTILSFLAIGVASAAMLAALVLNTYVEKNTEGVTEALSATGALEAEVASVKDAVELNTSMIAENKGAIERARGEMDAMRRSQARAELLNRSNALEELSATAPRDVAQKLSDISRGLRQLASSL